LPHTRIRHILPLLKKRLKLWPVLGILGSRQVGKSTLLREQLQPIHSSQYLTLDTKLIRDKAIKHPDHFLETLLTDNFPSLILDEVQKAPDLFDAIKVIVDKNRRPGRFILSGSTEFSNKTGIRESLTGRIGILRLFPMTLAECENIDFSFGWLNPEKKENSPSQSQLIKRVNRGGMPGICFLRSKEERASSFDGWLETTCFRDIQQIRGPRLNGNLALDILTQIATLRHPTLAEISFMLKLDSRRVKAHLEALEALFVINRLNANSLGQGKSMYFIADSGMAAHLGANELKQVKTWLLNECLAQHEYSGEKEVKITYYQSPKKSFIDFIIENKKGKVGVLISDEESPSTYVLRAAEAFLKKDQDAKVWLAYPGREIYKENSRLTFIPWANLT
jgi:predicted AAA+ superfamily ATPase